jgi:chromosome partitioning protein
MRVREHTRANEQLHHYLATLPVPVVGWLRDTQNYVQLAAHGLTLWDVAPSRVERDLEQWQPLVDWVRAAMNRYPHLADLGRWSAARSAAANG